MPRVLGLVSERRAAAGWAVTLAVALAAPLVMGSYQLSIATSVLTFAMLGLGLNIVVGYAGLLDLGYAAFFAIGAYTSSLLSLEAGLGFWQTLPFAVVATAIGGCIIGYPTLRLRSDYLAIVTLGFGEIVRIIATNLTITGGPNGLYGIPAPGIAGVSITSIPGLYYLGLAFTVAALLLSWVLSRSWLGYAWRSLREDETAAEAVGVPTVRVKLLAYVMGAIVGGVAGPFFAARFGAVDPTSFTFLVSVQILLVVIVGGMGSLPGVLLGALVIIALPEALRAVADFRLLIFALALIALMVFRPQGLWPAPRPRGAPRGRPVPAAPLEAAAPATRGQPAAGEDLLTVAGVSRRFGGVRAVDDVSFTVRTGEIVSIIGPNGAGKTTLFNCITGVTKPDAGRVVLHGGRHGRRVLHRRAPHRVVAAGLARTFQGIRLFDGLSAADNVLVGRYCRRRRDGWRTSRGLTGGLVGVSGATHAEVRRWLGFVGLGDRGDSLARELSYGERRRLEIARALASEPFAVLLDEPAAGTNPTEKNELMGLIRQVRDSGVSVVLIEHDMDLVMSVSDRVIVMDQGQMIAEGTPEQVRGNQRVIDAYLGGEEETAAETVEEVLGWRS
ncbi:MAG: ATP-binding cassette domain-containing protein [Streptosporangiales bacterium]|nr:ATP-binding cassette domain-containing protein [Streptosporangiales bacterium]